MEISDLIRGIEYAIEQDVNIINISIVTKHNEQLQGIINKAIQKGIIVVTSAGNDSIKSDREIWFYKIYPGAYEGVINVGSTNKIGVKSKFSNFGEMVDIFAPGEEIYTTGLNGGYQYKEGTSFSAPIVTGIVGLLKAEIPSLTPQEIKTILKETTEDNIVNANGVLIRAQEMNGIKKGGMPVAKEDSLVDNKMGIMGNKKSSDKVTIEDLIKAVEKNNNAIHDLSGVVENTYMKQTMQVLYKHPNKFRIIVISTANIEPIVTTVNDGEYMQTEYKKTKGKKIKVTKTDENYLFKLNYYLDWEIISELLLKANNPVVIKENDSIYKIEITTRTLKNEIWIDYNKGMITQYNIYQEYETYKYEKIHLEVKEFNRYGEIYFPINIDLEMENMQTEIRWDNIEINKGIDKNEFKLSQ